MIVYDIIFFVWVCRITANLLSYIQLWYVKEYRLDRMLIHMRTKQGKRFLFQPFRRPPVSPKTIFLFICTSVVEACFLFFTPINIFIRFVLADIFLFVVVSFFVFVFRIPTLVYHYVKIKQAVKKLRSHKRMTVIGITGSYGKTSTKEILATLLNQKYKVLKTEVSKNSPIAIAECILTSLRPDHEVFVVEMGAYKQGEIHQMCAMVQPEIGIVTAINAQHQDLFGSIETTMKAKYELVQGLVGRKIVIANTDNLFVRTMISWAKRDGKETQEYSVKDKNVSIFASNITEAANGIVFVVHFGTKTRKIDVHLFGKHQVSNVLAATMAAINCGMTLDEVCTAAKYITPFTKTMKPMSGIHGSMFIDDTFNNNPDAAHAAIDFLVAQKGKKFFVFQPMIELGRYERDSHKEVGEHAAHVCDEIILTNNNSFQAFADGVRAVNPKKHVVVMDSDKAAIYLIQAVGKGDTVLFKGREAGRVLAKLQKMKETL